MTQVLAEAAVQERIEVAAAIVRDTAGRVLLSKRPDDKHQGGRWEFPGGKLEPGESAGDALARELREELDLDVSRSRPFMTVQHHYPELSVKLRFREVLRFDGEPRGLEGQQVEWFPLERLVELDFPPANRPVVSALLLPDFFAILPGGWSRQDFNRALASLGPGAGVYLRGLEKDPEELLAFAEQCRERGVPFMVRNDAPLAATAGASVLHFSSDRLARGGLPSFSGLRSAAVHNEAELRAAVDAGLDMVFVSPVSATPSHPQAQPLGWKGLASLASGIPLAVYALGGTSPRDLEQARQAGARGVAGIRGFWKTGDERTK